MEKTLSDYADGYIKMKELTIPILLEIAELNKKSTGYALLIGCRNRLSRKFGDNYTLSSDLIISYMN